MERNGNIEGVRKLWKKYRFAVLVMLAGVMLLMWNDGSTSSTKEETVQTEALWQTEQRMEEILGTMAGVGQVQVMLTLDSDGRRHLAGNEELSYRGDTRTPEDYSRSFEAIVLDGTEGEAPLVTQRTYPTYRGALVVCQGGDRADVRLAVTQAVMSLTGLGAERIAVAKWQ